eukprot:scaffold35110_cov142-Isochrysis_galbana.AAC.4
MGSPPKWCGYNSQICERDGASVSTLSTPDWGERRPEPWLLASRKCTGAFGRARQPPPTGTTGTRFGATTAAAC